MADFPIVSVLILLPVLGAVLCMLVPRAEERTAPALALTVSLLVFAASIPLFWIYDAAPDAPAMQLMQTVAWVPAVGLQYAVGLDGMALLLVLLTTFLTPIAVIASWGIGKRPREFFAALLFLEAAVIGVFAARDLILFYVFWEFTLVPMLLMIGVWGGERRVYAAVKFFIYTMAGSLFMLAAILYVYVRAGAETFEIEAIRAALAALPADEALTRAEGLWLFGAFALAFAIKVPIFPLHTWLPDAHTEAPTAGSVMLAAVLLKLGTYALLRLAIPFFPEAAVAFAPWMVALAVVGIIYGALMALAQTDIKRLIAYSSVSHMGFVVLGIFAWNEVAVKGAVYQMLGHGLSTGALFLVVGSLYERYKTRAIDAYGGVARIAPRLAVVFMIALLSSIGLPGLNGFIGEFLILIGAFAVSPLAAACAALGVILGAVYMLTLYQRTMLGEAEGERHLFVKDLSARELVYYTPLIALMVLMGLLPTPFLSLMDPWIRDLLPQVERLLGG